MILIAILVDGLVKVRNISEETKNIDARITEQNSIVSILHHENIIRDKDLIKSLIENGFDVNVEESADTPHSDLSI